MRVKTTLGTLFAVLAALLVAFATPALAKGGSGGGGGGGGGDAATTPCAQIVSAVVNPNPINFDPHVLPQSGSLQPSTALDVTVNNMCLDEGGGPRGSSNVSLTTYDTATGAWLGSSGNMDPPGGQLTWRWWLGLPTTDSTTLPAHTLVISVTKPNGQVQDTVTTTAAALNDAMLAAVATQTPQSLR
jgi:hypothetical protein